MRDKKVGQGEGSRKGKDGALRGFTGLGLHGDDGSKSLGIEHVVSGA